MAEVKANGDECQEQGQQCLNERTCEAQPSLSMKGQGEIMGIPVFGDSSHSFCLMAGRGESDDSPENCTVSTTSTTHLNQERTTLQVIIPTTLVGNGDLRRLLTETNIVALE